MSKFKLKLLSFIIITFFSELNNAEINNKIKTSKEKIRLLEKQLKEAEKQEQEAKKRKEAILKELNKLIYLDTSKSK